MAQTISMPAMHGEEGINTTSALDEEKEITKVLMKKYFQIHLKKGWGRKRKKENTGKNIYNWDTKNRQETEKN